MEMAEDQGEGEVVKRLVGGGLVERNSLRAEAQDWGSRGGDEARRGRQWGGGEEDGDWARVGGRVEARLEARRSAVRCMAVYTMQSFGISGSGV